MSDVPQPFAIDSAAIETAPIQIPGATPGGIAAQLLNIDLERGIVATIIHFRPGAEIPAHFHKEGAEAHFVLEGELTDGDRTYGPGAYLTHAAGVVHGPHRSEKGCRVLTVQGGKMATGDSDFHLAAGRVVSRQGTSGANLNRAPIRHPSRPIHARRSPRRARPRHPTWSTSRSPKENCSNPRKPPRRPTIRPIPRRVKARIGGPCSSGIFDPFQWLVAKVRAKGPPSAQGSIFSRSFVENGLKRFLSSVGSSNSVSATDHAHGQKTETWTPRSARGSCTRSCEPCGVPRTLIDLSWLMAARGVVLQEGLQAGRRKLHPAVGAIGVDLSRPIEGRPMRTRSSSKLQRSSRRVRQ